MLYLPGGFDRMLTKWANDASGVERPLEEVVFDMFEDTGEPGPT